jgi:cytochrome oxidase Cu insertion factor (SCO1/SenC/PrrC family)
MLAGVEAGERSLAGRHTRIRWALWGLVVALGIGAGVAIFALNRSSPKPAAFDRIVGGPAATWAAGARRAPAFSLVDQDAQPVSLAALRGRPVIVTFIDPLCRDVCPLEAQRLDAALRSLPPASRPAVLSVSVNVYANSRANLVRDAHKWRLLPQWRWAIGSPAQLARVWKRYDVGVLVTTKKVAGVAVHDVTHTLAVYLVDRNGYERALYLWPFTAADVTQSLRQLASS